MRVIAYAEVQTIVYVEEDSDWLHGWESMREEAIELARKKRKNLEAWSVNHIAPPNNSLNSDWGAYQTGVFPLKQ